VRWERNATYRPGATGFVDRRRGILSVAGSMLAFDQFYIISNGGPRNSTLTAVYWIFSQSFVSFKLGYGAALSMVLLVIL
jgi:multiple sugar transport system permease protein